MDFTQKLILLEKLKASKCLEYKRALKRYSKANQKEITFSEVSGLKEELEELNSLITVIKKVGI